MTSSRNWKQDNEQTRSEVQSDFSLQDYFHLFLTWIITLNGGYEEDEDNNTYKNTVSRLSRRNYTLLTEVTNYVFFFGGRFRTVKNRRQFSLIILTALNIPIPLYTVFLLNKPSSILPITILFYYFWTSSLVNFILCATTDPGCLPRNIHLTDTTNLLLIPQQYNHIIKLPAATTSHNSDIQLKYCRTCRIWRPPRSFHCSLCNSCISTHDHHCIWMNNCIGRRNYRFFIAFLLSVTVACLLLITICIVELSDTNSKSVVVSVVLLCYAAVGMTYPVVLLSYHVVLTSRQQTTREYLKSLGNTHRGSVVPLSLLKVRKSEKEDGAVSGWNTGNAIKNVRNLMCEVRGCSFVEARGKSGGDWRFVDCDKRAMM